MTDQISKLVVLIMAIGGGVIQFRRPRWGV